MNIEQRVAEPARKPSRHPLHCSKPLRNRDILRTPYGVPDNPFWTNSSVIVDVTRDVGLRLYEILAITDLMREAYGKKDLETFRKQLALLTTETTRFASTLSAIVELARFEAQPTDVVYERFDIIPLLREVVHTTRLSIGSKPVAVMDVASPGPVFITSDRARIRQIMAGLMNNSAQFTFRGRIAVILNTDDDGARITVTDTGVGMTSEEISAFFGPRLKPGDKESAIAETGGRGLRIIRNLVAQLNGAISVSSKPGEGTIVEIFLPCGRSAGRSEPQTMSPREQPTDAS
jgi:signal transduction histidine kinase